MEVAGFEELAEKAFQSDGDQPIDRVLGTKMKFKFLNFFVFDFFF